jgi:tryptophanyl-tRNA synthetase
MGIKTDSTPMEEKKNAKDCNVFQLYRLLATEKQSENLKAKYAAGNFGYGYAKQELFDLICDKYTVEREKFNYLMENKDIIEKELQKGAEKAKVIAREVLQRVRINIGY